MSLVREIRIDTADCLSTAYTCHFSTEEHSALRMYVADSERLAKSQPLQTGFPCNFSVSATIDQPSTVVATLPTNDELSILLHRLRPFILDKEAASFVKVRSIIGREIPNDAFKAAMRNLISIYDGRRF